MRDLYTIASSGTIACLGGISAPITVPFHTEKSNIISLLNKGHEIYKHNPSKTSEKVLVTLENINSITFAVSTAQATEERILQKSLREEQTKYITEVHTKNTQETTVEESLHEEEVLEDTKVEPQTFSNNGNNSDKKSKKHHNKLNGPDSFQKV